METTMALPIGREAVKNAQKLLRKYKAGKTHLERRVIASENWWKLRNWREIDPKKQQEPVSAWLWNCITGKHADAMAAFPEPAILPRMADDRGEARKLTAILPVILEQNDFQEVYSDCAWQKLLQGTAIYGVFWEGSRLNGLGDVAIRKVDVLNLYWEPGISDIQQSRHLFHVELQDNESLVEAWPQLQGKLKSAGMTPSRYVYDDLVDTSDKSLVVDWYYRKKGKLHFVKFVGEEVLFATENDPENYPEGWYRDGNYPFVFDRLFPVNGSPCGYSYIDIGKSAQESIDLLNQAIIKNAVMSATPRYFARTDGAVNEKEFQDLSKPFVHVNGNLGEDSLKQIHMAPLDSVNLAILNNKIEELKFTCGNTDVQAGGAVSGVTAASAIAALQEAAGRTSRDSAQSAYRAYSRMITLVIERIRQFYDWSRQFRILGEMGEESFVTYDNGGIRPIPLGHGFGETQMRLPVFDIQVSAQRESPYTKMSQNELAIQMMGLGVFNPQLSDQALMLLDMMDFKGKDELMQKISKNQGLMGQLKQFQQMALSLAKKYEPQMAQGLEAAMQKGQPFAPESKGVRLPESDNMAGRVRREPVNVQRAREQAEEAATPQ
ncbi:MAG: hypothetical protein IJ461_05870 [Clostridia bacterium]|nr:hypothetical protein [Clostridia bacterium]